MRRVWILTKHTYLCYLSDQCTQFAAAISYYILFSMVPLAIFTISVFGVFLSSESIRDHVVERTLDTVPLTQTEGRDAVLKTLDSVKRVSGPVAALGLVATLWTASAVFASIRKSLNAIWRVDEHRPFAQQKLVDFAQVGVLSAILLASMVLTGILRAIRTISADWVGPFGGRNPLWEVPPIALPAILTLTTFLLLYRIVPAARPRWRDVVPGALLATILFEAVKNSFAFYVANFNDFDVVYGSLAGILLFLLYTFLASNILLIGAEVSYTSQRYHRGDFAAEIETPPDTPVSTRVMRALRGLFVRQSQA